MTRCIAVALFMWALPAHAQTSPDPTGHWEGLIQAAGLEAQIAVDLSRSVTGELKGTFSSPGEGIDRLPLRISADEAGFSFSARADQTFRGSVAADGRTMAVTWHVDGYSLPFTMVRTGEPRIRAASTNPAVREELEGAWRATAMVGGRRIDVVLRLTNQPDGTATGVLINLSDGALEIPANLIAQPSPARLTMEFVAVSGSLEAALSAAADELSGTFTQGALNIPVTFHRGHVQ